MASGDRKTAVAKTSAKKTTKKAAKNTAPAKSATAAKKNKIPSNLADRKSMPKEGRDAKGGLTDIGRAWYKARFGMNLKPGVRGPADTPEKMRRKGSFLVRSFTHPRGPMTDQRGRPTRLALSAHAWGEPIPKTMEDAHALAAEGRKLLERYRAAKTTRETPAGTIQIRKGTTSVVP